MRLSQDAWVDLGNMLVTNFQEFGVVFTFLIQEGNFNIEDPLEVAYDGRVARFDADSRKFLHVPVYLTKIVVELCKGHHLIAKHVFGILHEFLGSSLVLPLVGQAKLTGKLPFLVHDAFVKVWFMQRE